LTALVFGSGNALWFASSKDNGHSFSVPSEIARVPVLALGRHRGPRVAISQKTIVVSAVYGTKAATGPHAHGLPASGDLVAWRSTNGGQSWSEPVVVNDVPGAAREGLHAMSAGDKGELAAVWLDLRAPGTRLYGSYSRDAGAHWSANVLLFESPEGTICQCCDPSIVAADKHTFSVMFRNVSGGMRDMYLLTWRTDGAVSRAEKIGQGSWALDACPMDGGGLAPYQSKTVTAWRRDHTVYLASPGQPEKALGDGKDVSLAASQKGTYVAWTNASGVQLQEPDRDAPRPLSTAGAFPTLTALPNGHVLASWEQAGQIATLIIP
jgi:hypothetical protein